MSIERNQQPLTPPYEILSDVCPVCKEPYRGTHEACLIAVEDYENEQDHQKAFNKLTADKILTLQLMVASYIETLADKDEPGEVITFWRDTCNIAMANKHKFMRS